METLDHRELRDLVDPLVIREMLVPQEPWELEE